MNLIAAFLAWLASLLYGPSLLEVEHAKSAAAVAAARASMTREDPPPPPRPRVACEKCQDAGWIRIDAKTRRQCDCGSGASPTSARPATP